MGKDDLFHKRRETRKKRMHNIKTTRNAKWLILCEGKETEVNYLNGLIKEINKAKGSNFNPKIIGVGRNPSGLVNFVKQCFEIRDNELGKVSIPYGKVVLVFDKDDFTDHDFNNAALQALKSSNIDFVAWSNESFELWLILHFELQSSGLGRNQYCNRLTEIFRKEKLCGQKEHYLKNDKDIYLKVASRGSGTLEKAIRNAERLLKNKDLNCPSQINPGTTMHLLVKEIIAEVDCNS